MTVRRDRLGKWYACFSCEVEPVPMPASQKVVGIDLGLTTQFIALEKLDIQDMQSNGNKAINRGIGDVAWHQFIQTCLYKAEEAGRTVVLVDPRNTTQECSGCGQIVPKTLRERVHQCDSCGLNMNRDLNAAINILRRRLASLDSVIQAHSL